MFRWASRSAPPTALTACNCSVPPTWRFIAQNAKARTASASARERKHGGEPRAEGSRRPGFPRRRQPRAPGCPACPRTLLVLKLERFGLQPAVALHQDLDLRLRLVQLPAAIVRERHTLLEEADRIFERQVGALELGHDRLQALQALFEAGRWRGGGRHGLSLLLQRLASGIERLLVVGVLADLGHVLDVADHVVLAGVEDGARLEVQLLDQRAHGQAEGTGLVVGERDDLVGAS